MVDEAILQMSLGKMEAVDKVEQAKDRLHTTAISLQQSRHALSSPVKQKFDELRLQLKLGRMETRDTYYQQLTKLGESVKAAEKALSDSGHEAAEDFKEAANDLFDRIYLLGFQIEMAEKRVADEIRFKRAKVKDQLHELKERIQENIEAADAITHDAVDECYIAYQEIRANLTTLFKH